MSWWGSTRPGQTRPGGAQAEEGVCQDNKLRRHVVTIDDYQDVPPNDERALMKAVANQPVSVAIEADQVGRAPAACVW